MLVQLETVRVGFGGPWVLDHADLHVAQGERIALLGRNGAGKSTLLGVLAGTVEVDDGRVMTRPGLRVGVLPQAIPRDLSGTVAAVVAGGLDDATRANTAEARRLAQTAISRVDLDAEADAATLSAGQARRALLARALVREPDLLLLDEPTNHLDVEGIEWLETFLLRRGGTLLFVTHDRAFLRRLATRILDLDHGRLTSWPGDYDRYREVKQRGLAAEAKAEALFDKRLAAEEVWIRKGVREQRGRSKGRVEALQAMRRARAERREREGAVTLEAQGAAPSGRLVVEAKGVAFAWGPRTIVRDLTTTILRGDRVGLLGPNGSGKTTLLRLLLGELAPAAGSLRHGTNLEIATFDQRHAVLDDARSAIENLGGTSEFVTVNGKKRHAIGYLADFLFTPSQARSPVAKLSGGERNRLVLARLLARPSNVLVLDEPTNDLDLDTLERLEALLLDYEGTVLLVSHDRDFLDGIVTSTLVLEGEGRVSEHAGGWDAWRLVRDRRAAEAAARAAPRAASKAPVASPPRRTKAEKQELKDLPGRIETLEAERADLHRRMGDPTFFRQPGEAIAAARRRLDEVEQAIEVAYARWATLDS